MVLIIYIFLSYTHTAKLSKKIYSYPHISNTPKDYRSSKDFPIYSLIQPRNPLNNSQIYLFPLTVVFRTLFHSFHKFIYIHLNNSNFYYFFLYIFSIFIITFDYILPSKSKLTSNTLSFLPKIQHTYFSSFTLNTIG